MGETTTIEFVIPLSGGEHLSESDALKRAAEDPRVFGNYAELEGQLVFSNGEAELLIDDVLAPLCLALVRVVIPKLAADGAIRVMARASDLDVDFSLEADMVTVSTAIDAALAMPRDGFEAAARGVARRYSDLAIQIWPDEPQAQALKDYIDNLSG